jgi:hypothetical protein|tara:strand:+ start:384 stop:605 length:222 start_codon:yes stop_codon:yes gene_type:complete
LDEDNANSSSSNVEVQTQTKTTLEKAQAIEKKGLTIIENGMVKCENCNIPLKNMSLTLAVTQVIKPKNPTKRS